MNNTDTLSWLYAFTSKGIKLDLENTVELLKMVGDPHLKMKHIHVGGTDGKGSICACIFSIMMHSGQKTGLYTSPHIIEFNERISVNGQTISDEELTVLANELRPAVEDMESRGYFPTFFEVTTVLAFMHFRSKGVEYAVVEVGMGGRFDSTNVITPEVCVIGNVSMDHQQYLGNTLEKIAFEKAGIMKPGVPCVTINDDAVFGVLQKRAEEIGAPLIRLDPEDICLKALYADRTEFQYKEEDYTVNIPGSVQARNASLAIEAVSKLKIFGYCIRCNIKKGLKGSRWPCRLEKIDKLPLILDVTHTAAGSAALVSDIRKIYGEADVVIGMLEDKDVDTVLEDLSKISDRIWISPLKTERTADPKRLETAAKGRFEEVFLCDSISQAMDSAFGENKGRYVLVTGSFHTAEEALDWLKRTYAGYWTYSQMNTKKEHIPEDHRKG